MVVVGGGGADTCVNVGAGTLITSSGVQASPMLVKSVTWFTKYLPIK